MRSPSPRHSRLLAAALLAASLGLGACERGSDMDGFDNQLIGNDADPALTSALQDQILVDPTLTQQSNRNAVRPAETPMQAQYPSAPQATDAPAPSSRSAAAARPGAGGRIAAAPASRPAQARPASGCVAADSFDYDKAWAGRLPAGFQLYPGARLTDAAGSDAAGCRVVTFSTRDAPQRVLAHYRERATQAGYSAEQQRRHGDLVLAGTGGAGAYYLIVTPLSKGGSDAALIVRVGA
jgi:hypothetical protein